jgi:hypothetical protein
MKEHVRQPLITGMTIKNNAMMHGMATQQPDKNSDYGII